MGGAPSDALLAIAPEGALHRLADLQAVHAAVPRLLAGMEPDEVAAAAVSAARRLCDAEGASLYERTGRSLRLRSSDGGRDSPGAAAPAALRSLTTPGSLWEAAGDGGCTAAVALHGSEGPVGVLRVDSSALPAETCAVRLGMLAEYAGPALDHARRFAQQRSVAERMTALERAKAHFLNLASHELRTPLAVLTGYLSLLEDGAFGPIPDKLRTAFPSLNARLAEMNDLIGGMLETARLDDERLELNLRSVDLRDVVRDAVERTELHAREGQRVHVGLPEARVPVNVDAARVELIVANLVHNALKYSLRGTDVHCDVAFDGSRAEVRVQDQGVGIAESDRLILFTRFGRIRNSAELADVPGTGLGLYLAHELARAHGGEIHVSSAAGEGSTFTLHLPCDRRSR